MRLSRIDPWLPLPARGHPRLLADIGGTHARFGWQERADEPVGRVLTLPCAGHASLEDAVRAYLSTQGLATPQVASLAVATAITEDTVAMTNHPWTFSVEELRHRLGLQGLLVLNDFTALALALPGLPPAQRRAVGGGQAVPGAAVGLLGPGTGLGVSGLIPGPGTSAGVPLIGEGGHVSLAAANAEEDAVIALLRQAHGHVSAERVVSGPGLVLLHATLARVRQQPAPAEKTPAEVLQQAMQDPQSLAREAVMMFCGFLGSVAGNLALTLGARGGVYLGGGIVPRMGPLLDASPFRERFEAKGRFSRYLAAIPTWVIEASTSPALDGASLALTQALTQPPEGADRF